MWGPTPSPLKTLQEQTKAPEEAEESLPRGLGNQAAEPALDEAPISPVDITAPTPYIKSPSLPPADCFLESPDCHATSYVKSTR